MAPRTLVTGSTGNIGSIVATQLQQAGHPFVAGTRRPLSEEAGFPGVPIDFGDVESLRRAMDGIDTLFLLLPITDAVEQHAEIALHVATQAGVRHIVRSSAAGADASSPFPLLRLHGQIDDAVRATGIAYTLTRPASFMQNFITFYGQGIVAGTMYSAAGAGKTGWVDVRDVGAVNAAIIQRPQRWRNQALTITGEQLLTKETAVAMIGAALGKTIAVVAISDADVEQMFRGMGMSDYLIGILASTDRMTRAGLLERTTTVVREVTGRAPIAFATFVEDYRAAWDPANVQNPWS